MTEPLDRLQAALADRYRLDREIGAGGMATVYLAEDLKHRRHVALKVLRPELSAVLGAERFLKEIELTANLQHSHLLPLFDSGEVAGLLYYVMPYVEGESLRARLDREKQLGIDEAVRITTQVASALGYAHRHGILHRDIKPENILLHEGQALIADFGIALALRQAGGSRLTETGLSLGTPQYMSPEQAGGDRALDARSDLYSLACVLYEMLAGEPPHTGPTVQAVIAKLLADRPRLVTDLRSTVPIHIAVALETALAKLPADRFGTMDDFVRALSPSAAGLTSVVTPPPRERPRVRWERWGPVAVAAAAVAAALAAWLAVVPRDGQVDTSTRRLLVTMGNDLPAVMFQGGDIALSPDGRRVAYLAVIDGIRRIVLRDWGSLTGAPLRGTDGAVTPFFSPSGKSIAFFTLAPDRLRVIPLDGGPPVVLVDTGVVARGAAWGDDGFIYYSNPEGLARVKESGGPPEQVTRRDAAAGESAHVYPEALPGGRGVLFTVRRGSTPEYDIGIADSPGGAYRVIGRGVLARYSASGHLVVLHADGTLAAAPFDLARGEVTGAMVPLVADVSRSAFGVANLSLSRAGQLIAQVGSNASDSTRLVWVDRQGKVTLIDSTWRAFPFATPSLSGDGRRLVVTATDAAGDDAIWIKDLPSGTPRRLIGDMTGRPVLSRDGNTVSYLSAPRPDNDLYRIPVAGGQPELVLDWTANIWEGLWSRSGEWFVFRVGGQFGTEAGRDVYARWGTDTTTVPILVSGADEKAIQLSPDDRYLAYESNATGRNEVYVRPFPGVGAGSWQVTSGGGREPRWSSNGAELFFRDGTSGDMMVASIVMTPEFRIAGIRRLFSARGDGWRLGTEENFRAYDVAPDDQRFVMIQRFGQQRTELLLIENWFTELREKVPPR